MFFLLSYTVYCGGPVLCSDSLCVGLLIQTQTGKTFEHFILTKYPNRTYYNFKASKHTAWCQPAEQVTQVNNPPTSMTWGLQKQCSVSLILNTAALWINTARLNWSRWGNNWFRSSRICQMLHTYLTCTHSYIHTFIDWMKSPCEHHTGADIAYVQLQTHTRNTRTTINSTPLCIKTKT